jgi:hypothetical protein
MAAPSPAALLGPCIERIYQGASGRKYNKLRQDAKVRWRVGQPRDCTIAVSRASAVPGVLRMFLI